MYLSEMMRVSSLKKGLLNQHEAGGGENSRYRNAMQRLYITEKNAVKQKETEFI